MPRGVVSSYNRQDTRLHENGRICGLDLKTNPFEYVESEEWESWKRNVKTWTEREKKRHKTKVEEKRAREEKSKCSEQGQTARKRSRDRKETPVHLVSHARFIWNTVVEATKEKEKPWETTMKMLVTFFPLDHTLQPLPMFPFSIPHPHSLFWNLQSFHSSNSKADHTRILDVSISSKEHVERLYRNLKDSIRIRQKRKIATLKIHRKEVLF